MGKRHEASARAAVVVGLASLAAAIGIGRFAPTPVFPLMQESLGTRLVEGAWMAIANYIGYLLGACVSFVLTSRAGAFARWGLLAVALSTLAMGIADSLGLWLFLRAVAGVASAFVLVDASAWALASLTFHRRGELAGWVFAGVGIGICLAGLVALAVATSGGVPGQAWAALGAIALVVTMVTWRCLSIAAAVPTAEGPAAQRLPLDRSAWLLVACYGVFGFGYIIPATFIPAAARAIVTDPVVFGWAWPLFGLAAASTVVVTTRLRPVTPRTSAAVSLLVIAVGVSAPAVHMGLATLALSAACVGGTFMVVTMAAMQEARRMWSGDPTRLIAALTAAFAPSWPGRRW